MGTIASHRFPRAACNYGFHDAGVNSGEPRRFYAAKPRPEIITPKKPEKSNLRLFELHEQKGFIRSQEQPEEIFIEFTPEGPELFIFTKNGIELCDRSVLPDDRYVEITRRLAINYNYNPRILAEPLSMVSFEINEWGRRIAFMKIDTGISSVGDANYYFPVSAAYSYCPTTVFELPRATLVNIYHQDAKAEEQRGKIVYTADAEFAYDKEVALERGYMPGGEEYYICNPNDPKFNFPKAYLITVSTCCDLLVRTR